MVAYGQTESERISEFVIQILMLPFFQNEKKSNLYNSPNTIQLVSKYVSFKCAIIAQKLSNSLDPTIPILVPLVTNKYSLVSFCKILNSNELKLLLFV